MSLKDILRDVGFSLRPDFIVGCRYYFGTTYNGKALEIEGFVSHVQHSVSGSIRYGIHGHDNQVVQVIALIKLKDVWLLQVVGGETFVLSLEGNFTLV